MSQDDVELTSTALGAIADFQSYVVRRYGRRTEPGTRYPRSKELIQRVADALAQSATHRGRSVDLLRVGRLLRVGQRLDCESKRAVIAWLVPVDGGFHISVNRSRAMSEGRLRFSIAHEYGHTLFFSLYSSPPRRIVPMAISNTPGYRWEEGLCHDFARALLLPKGTTYEAASGGIGLGLLERICSSYVVSMDVAVRRILYDLRLWRSTILYRVDIEERSVEVFRGTSSRRSPTSNEIGYVIKGLDREHILARLSVLDGLCAKEMGFPTSKRYLWLRC